MIGTTGVSMAGNAWLAGTASPTPDGRALLLQRRRRIVLRQGYGRQGSAALPGLSLLGHSFS